MRKKLPRIWPSMKPVEHSPSLDDLFSRSVFPLQCNRFVVTKVHDREELRAIYIGSVNLDARIEEMVSRCLSGGKK